MSMTDLAKLFKERENKPYMGPVIGRVISPPPGIRVSVGSKIILDSSHLIIAAQVLSEYERNVSVDNVSTTAPSDITKIDGKLKYTDTLKAGDEVILIPTADIQTYYLIDKAVRL